MSNTTSKIIERQAKTYWRKKNWYEQPTTIVVCHLVFCWHAKGILSTFVSLSSTNDWAIHRDRQTILHNRLALLTNKCCMKSLISGGILLAWAVFLELLLIITLTCWTYWWTKRRRYDENVCFSLHGNGGLYVNCVLYQDGQGKGHENPKMVIILRGGGERGLRLNTSVLPLVLFSDCKIKSRLLPEQSKAAIWNSGNLELKNKLEWSVNFSAGSGGGKKVLTRTTHSSFTTQSNCLNMFTRNSTTLKH